MTITSDAVIYETPIVWNEYSTAEEALDNAKKINTIAGLANFSIIRNMHYFSAALGGTHTYLIISITTLALATLGAAIYGKFVNDDAMQINLCWNSVFSTANLIYSLAKPSFYFTGLPILSIMCIYSIHLQIKGLTPRRYIELGLARLLEMIRFETDKSCHLLEKVVKKNLYSYFYVNSEDMTPADFLLLLSEAYRNKKILYFSSLVLPPPKHTYTYYVGDSAQTYSVTYDTDEVIQEMEDHLNRQGYHEKVMDSFQISVNYLIQCKEMGLPLDEQLINEQLKHLTPLWGNSFDDYKLKLSPNLKIENGVPVIVVSYLDELRTALPLKLKLSKYFDKIIERCI